MHQSFEGKINQRTVHIDLSVVNEKFNTEVRTKAWETV